MQYNYSKKKLTRRAKPIRITSVRIGGFLLCMYCTSCRSVVQKIKKVPVHSVYAADQQMHTGALLYIINYPHVSVAIATIFRVPLQQY